MPQVSFALVVYNDEERIRNCVESIRNLMDELVVVFDGPCKDETMNILLEYQSEGLPIKIFVRPNHIGMPCPHRAFSFEKTSHEWVFVIDSDQRLSADFTKKMLHDLISHEGVDAYGFLQKFLENGEYILDQSLCYVPVLFRKSKMYYVGMPHNPILTRGKVKKEDYTIFHDSAIFEINLINKLSVIRSKYIPRAKIHAKYLLMPYDKISIFQASREDWDTIKRRRIVKYSLLIGIFYLFYNPINFLFFKRGYRTGKYALFSAIFRGFNSFMVCYYVFIYKYFSLK